MSEIEAQICIIQIQLSYGNEEVKLACLTALASWVARSTDAIRLEVVSFIASGLKEKESLRRGYLRCLRVICKNADAVFPMSSLLLPLIQLVKTGFTKAAQWLDGIYALLIVMKAAQQLASLLIDPRVWRQASPLILSIIWCLIQFQLDSRK